MIFSRSNDRRFGAACSAVAVLLLVAGCPVDERTFVATEDVTYTYTGGHTGGRSPAGGRASGGLSSGGSPAQSGSSNPPSAGGGSTGGSPAPRACPDLDENGIEDCDETLVENADFSLGIANWRAEPNIVIEPGQEEASENSLPGSLGVSSVRALETDALVTAGASQCVVLSGG